jgi:hypothetical protein
MKKTVLFLLIMSFFACSTPEKRAKELIKENLSKTLDDYDSYQSVEFGKLTPLTWSELMNSGDDYAFQSIKIRMEGGDKSISNNYNDLSEKYKLRQGQLEQAFPEENKKRLLDNRFLEYKMDHKFRAKNRMGTYLLAHYVYFFDSSLTKITGIEDLTE